MTWILLVIILIAAAALFFVMRLSLVPAEKARALIRGGAMIVDVRSPAEFNSGHLPGALNLPVGTLAAEALRVLPDRDRPVLLHCLSGGRSEMARRELARLGYRQAFNLGSYARAKTIVNQVPQR